MDASVRVRRGPLDLDVSVHADPGEVVAVVGPNGAGKTTFLEALAGLVPGAEVAFDAPGEVGLVFQDRRLFPHLSALDNVAFGIGRRAGRRQAREWLERLGVGDVAGRRPHELSGGQAQRVALARALARRPAVLLLDEPFAAVDLAARSVVREVLRSGSDRVDVLVTHQPVDVLSLADQVVVLEEGRVVQAGSVDDVRSRPRSAWAAEVVGVNLLQGEAADGSLTTGATVVATASWVRGPALAVVHPHAVTLSRDEPHTSARNVWAGRVADVDVERDRARVRFVGPVDLVAEVTPAAVADLGLGPGTSVWASVKATEIDVYPA